MNRVEEIWLSLVDIENKDKRKLINLFGSLEKLYFCSLDDLVYFEIKEHVIFKILDLNLKHKAKLMLDYCLKNKIDIIYFKDAKYPKKFWNITDKPVCIYCKGDYQILDNEAVGIVGSRIALKESLEIARNCGRCFSKMGMNVVSGLAKGIDLYSHLGALEEEKGRKNNWSFGLWIR